MLARLDPNHTLSRATYRSKLRITLIVCTFTLSTFYFGYSLVYLSSLPITTIEKIYSITANPSLASGILNGCVPVGALISQVLISLLRQSVLFVNVVALLVGFFVFLPNFQCLVGCRIIQGICVGVYSSITSMIIKQLAPVQFSGVLGSIVQISIVLGMFVPYFLVYILKKATGDMSCESFWFLIFGFPLFTTLLQTLILLFKYPFETPKYWLLNNQQHKAREVILQLYQPWFADSILKQKKKDTQVAEEDTLSTSYSDTEPQMLIEKRAPYLRGNKVALLVAFTIAITNQLSGAAVVDIYCGRIARESLQGEIVLLIPSVVELIKLAAGVAAVPLLNRYGRRTLILPGLAGLSLTLFCIFTGFLLRSSTETASQAFVMTGMLAFMAVYGSTLAPVMWLYNAQIVSARDLSYAVCANWTLSSIVVVLFPIVEAYVLEGNPALIFLVFAVWCLVSCLICFKYMIETKDKNELQIRQAYNSQAKC